MWRAILKTWVTRQFFVEQMNLVFGLAVKRFLQANKFLLQVLLFLDSAPAHPTNFSGDILYSYKCKFI